MPLAWRFVMRDTFNTGFKVAAYVNMIFSAPYSAVYLVFLGLGESRDAAFYLDNAMKWSLAGIFFLNFFAIYVMIYLAITDSSSGVVDYIGVAAYLAYSFFAMMYSYYWVPGVARYYHEESTIPSTRRASQLNMRRDGDDTAPDMDDETYLEEVQ